MPFNTYKHRLEGALAVAGSACRESKRAHWRAKTLELLRERDERRALWLRVQAAALHRVSAAEAAREADIAVAEYGRRFGAQAEGTP
jgi:hypothetical protein